jgi:ADP-L-glycero-D-manno-heptose 6-epimerase
VHLGANSSTNQEANSENWDNNIQYSNELIKRFNNHVNKPIFIFASSAATYGNETSDFSERLNVRPTNFYGFTKLETEKAINSIDYKNNIYSLRFFNVYGAREAHKVGMSSPIYKWLTLPNDTIELFESLNPLFPTGKMARDFIHVDDVCSVIWHCINSKNKGGTYNVGSGVASTWEQVANTIFKTKNVNTGSIVYKRMPESISKHYQYYTCANLDKLRNVLNYNQEFLSLEKGIQLTYKQINQLYLPKL